MEIYNFIKKYEGYFHSIRLHDQILLLDLKFPKDWKIKEVLGSFNTTTQLKINDQTEHHVLISFYSPFSEEEIKRLVLDADNIIKWNKDKEEKNNILNMKILELKKVFESNQIESLRSINFDFKNNEVRLDNEELKLAKEGD